MIKEKIQNMSPEERAKMKEKFELILIMKL
jgi:hypothetical protein